MSRPLKKVAALLCDRCGYIEVWPEMSKEAVIAIALHCKVSMRGISAAELRKIDREKQS